MKKIILPLFLFTLFTGCQNDDFVFEDTVPVTIAFVNVYKDGWAGENVAAGTYVINDAAAWTSFTTGLNSLQVQDPVTGIITDLLRDAPVNFTDETVIAIIDELHYSGGYNLEITGIEQTTLNVTVLTATTSAGPGNATSVLTRPLHVVKIPKTALPVVFE